MIVKKSVLLQISHTLALIGTLNAAISGEGEGEGVAKLQQYPLFPLDLIILESKAEQFILKKDEFN
jgi:hypothetical protein